MEQSGTFLVSVKVFKTFMDTSNILKFLSHYLVSLDVHIPQSLDILKSFYEQVLTDISQQISIIAPLVSQPVGDFITASITMAFSSLDPPLADSYHFKEDMSINWLEDWYSVFEFYHNVMKECLYFAHKAASLAYTHCSTYLDIQVAISAVLEPAIKLVTNFPDLIDFVWCAYCKALVEKEQEEDNLPYDNAVQDVSSRISLLSRKVDNYVDHLRIMDSFMDICRQWVLGSQPSCLSILYRTSGRMIGNYILDKVSRKQFA